MGCITVIKAILTRLLFAAHSFVTIWRVVGVKGDQMYWCLAGALGLLFIETLYTLIKRKGYDFKWVCPSFFFFLCSSVPGIWLLELDRLDRERGIMANATLARKAENYTEGIGEVIPGVHLSVKLQPSMWVLVLEQALMFLIVIGRWLLPKGEITRDQLSQLLFVYIGLASDIMELFVIFEEEDVVKHPFLTYIILGVWSLSLMQFSLVLTATKARRKRVALITPDGHDHTAEDGDCSGCCKGKCCESELWSLFITVLFQDAPFLSLRLYVMVTFNIFNYTILFFTVKNALVIILQFYRMIVITCLKDDDDDDDDGGYDNKALIRDDDSDYVPGYPERHAWEERTSAREIKRRTPIGAASTGITAGHERPVRGYSIRGKSPARIQPSSEFDSSSLATSLNSLNLSPNAGTSVISASAVKERPDIQNKQNHNATVAQTPSPKGVRLVRVASTEPCMSGSVSSKTGLVGMAEYPRPASETAPPVLMEPVGNDKARSRSPHASDMQLEDFVDDTNEDGREMNPDDRPQSRDSKSNMAEADLQILDIRAASENVQLSAATPLGRDIVQGIDDENGNAEFTRENSPTTSSTGSVADGGRKFPKMNEQDNQNLVQPAKVENTPDPNGNDDVGTGLGLVEAIGVNTYGRQRPVQTVITLDDRREGEEITESDL